MTSQRGDTISLPENSSCVAICLTMPTSFCWCSKRWYEAAIEAIAAGIPIRYICHD